MKNELTPDAFLAWRRSLTTEQTHVFNLDGRGYEISRDRLERMAFEAGQAHRDAEIAALKADLKNWKEICVMYNTKYSEGTVEIAALRQAMSAVCEDCTVPLDARKVLESALYATLAQVVQA